MAGNSSDLNIAIQIRAQIAQAETSLKAVQEQIAQLGATAQASAATASAATDGLAANAAAAAASIKAAAIAAASMPGAAAAKYVAAIDRINSYAVDMNLFEGIGKGAAKNIAQLAVQEAALDRLMTAGAISTAEYDAALVALNAEEASITAATMMRTAAQEANTGATVENAVAQAGLTSVIASGNATREYGALLDEALRHNYSRMVGTTAVLGNRLGLLSLAFSGVGLAVIAIVAAFGGLVAAIVRDENEISALTKALEVSGNAAGTTTDDLRAMAQAMDQGTTTYHMAAEALARVASTGKVTGAAIAVVAQGAIDMAAVTGEKISETTKAFVSLSTTPLASAVKLNETYHFLSDSVIDQVAALQNAGDTSLAAAVAQQALADAMAARNKIIESQAGLFQKLGTAIADATSNVIHFLGAIGVPDTLQQKIDAVDKSIQAAATHTATWSRLLAGVTFGALGSEGGNDVAELEKERDSLLAQQRIQEQSAANQAKADAEADKHAAKALADAKALTAARRKADEIGHINPIPSFGSSPGFGGDTPSVSGSAQLASSGIADAEAHAQAMIQIKQQQAQGMLQAGRITTEQMIALERNYADESTQIAVQAEQQKLKLIGLTPDQIQSIDAKIQALEDQHQLRMVELTQQAEKAKADALQQSVTSYEQMLAPISQAFDQSIKGVIRGTTTIKNAMRDLGQSVVLSFIDMGVKMLVHWISTQLALTGATAAGESSRLAIKQAADKQSLLSTAMTTTKEILMKMWAVMTNVYNSVASIPFIGWILAPAMAVAAGALVASWAGRVASAAGGWVVPNDQLAMVHEREMILPRHISEGLQGMIAGGRGAGGGNVHLHVHAMDAAGVRDFFKKNQFELAAALRQAHRNGAFA